MLTPLADGGIHTSLDEDLHFDGTLGDLGRRFVCVDDFI